MPPFPRRGRVAFAPKTALMAKTYGAEGVVTKGGKPFTKQTLYKMLHNRMYLGEIVHKGQSFPGQHQAIVTQAQWDAVHALIATDGIERRRETNDRQPTLSTIEQSRAILRVVVDAMASAMNAGQSMQGGLSPCAAPIDR